MSNAVFTNGHFGNFRVTTISGEEIGHIPGTLVEIAQARLAAHDIANDRQSLQSLLGDLLCGGETDELRVRVRRLENDNMALAAKYMALDESTRERGFLPQTADGYFVAPGTVIWHRSPCGPTSHVVDYIDREGAWWKYQDDSGHSLTTTRDMSECYFQLENCEA